MHAVSPSVQYTQCSHSQASDCLPPYPLLPPILPPPARHPMTCVRTPPPATIPSLDINSCREAHCNVGCSCIKCRIRYGECGREQTLSCGRKYFEWIQHTTCIHATSFLVSAWFIVTDSVDTFSDVILLKYCCNVRMNDFPRDKYCSRPHSP